MVVGRDPQAARRPPDELEVLIRARYPIIYVVTWEEERLEQRLSEIARRRNKTFHVWTCSQGIVLATLHTSDSVQTIQRILSVFPHEHQNNVMYLLANSLQAILSQRLLPKADGKGQVLACEVCIATPAVRKRIREGEAHLIFSEMQMGRKHQMQTMDNVLQELYQKGEITYDVALSNAREPETIRSRSGQSNPGT